MRRPITLQCNYVRKIGKPNCKTLEKTPTSHYNEDPVTLSSYLLLVIKTVVIAFILLILVILIIITLLLLAAVDDCLYQKVVRSKVDPVVPWYGP